MTYRSNLTKLYPDVKSRTDNLSYKPIPRIVNIISTKLTQFNILSITAMLTVITSIAVLFFNYLKISIDADSLVRLMPTITIAAILWVSLLIMVLGRISNKLGKLGIDNTFFIFMYAICALPVAQLLYNIYQNLNNNTVQPIPYTMILFIENYIFVYSILTFINSKNISEKSKKVAVVASILLCVGVTVFNSFY